MEGQQNLDSTFDTENSKPITLSLEEAKLILSMIDVVNKRNGFTPKDFTAVGKIFDKLSSNVE
jgi:hypothetical protein